MFSQEKSGYIN
jgi:hypothetical protein